MDVNAKRIVDLLKNKSSLKQDVYEDTQAAFQQLLELVKEQIAFLKTQISDKRVRLNVVEKGATEFHVYIGSDVLAFNMHSNIFKLEDGNANWTTEYLKEDESRGYFGLIHIYNFLAESFLQNRYNDPGFLIGRIMVNKDAHFCMEGQGQLGFLFRDVSKGNWTPESIKHIIQVSFAFALDFDLGIPPYSAMEELTVGQIYSMGQDNKMSTGKSLGFKFKAEEE